VARTRPADRREPDDASDAEVEEVAMEVRMDVIAEDDVD
jgi:hypothetical protein